MTRNSLQESICSTSRALSSTRPASTASSFSFTTRKSERPPSLAPTNHTIPSIASRSSTAQGSIYSQDPEKALLPTFTTNINDKGETELKSHGEQIWESQHQSQASGGQRTEQKHQRGCVMPRASEFDQARWKMRVQAILGHVFRNVDLLEEALESPGSGVTVVGKTQRHFLDGNRGLAKVGEAVMTLVLRDQCYLFYMTENEGNDAIKRNLKDENLYSIGMNTTLQKYIRPHAPIRPSQTRKLVANIRHEFKTLGSDPVRTVANGIKAIIGAVYFDSGYETARRVMACLDLIIKVPEPR